MLACMTGWLSLLCLIASGAIAWGTEDRVALLTGRWGTDGQCRGDLLTPGGSVRAAPYVLSPEWLEHGGTWCRLTWHAPQRMPYGTYIPARGLCGEDAARVWDLAFVLDDTGPADTLRVLWGDSLVTSPMQRCPDPARNG